MTTQHTTTGAADNTAAHNLGEYHEAAELRSLPRGEYFRLKPNGSVYVREDYCRDIKRYIASRADDISSSRLFKSTQVVYVGFTY